MRDEEQTRVTEPQAGSNGYPNPEARSCGPGSSRFARHLVTGYTRDVGQTSSPVGGPSADELEFIFVSERPCLALCATVGERWRRGFERLRSPSDLADWYVRASICADTIPVVGVDLNRARAVRKAIYRTAKALIASRRPVSADEEIINRAASVPPPVPSMRLGVRSLGPVSAAAALSAVARDAIDLLTGPDLTRLRECASPECGLLFTDLSRPGSRRWCSSTTCGGRARAAAYRQRQVRATTAPARGVRS